MKKIAIAVTILLTALMLVPTINASSPRHCKGLDVYFYQTNDLAWAALKAGKVDFIQWALTFDQYTEACADPSLQLAKVDEMGGYQFDLNNNYTFPDRPNIRNPVNLAAFRQALACATDKQWIVNTVLKGFGSRTDLPMAAASQSGWADPSTYYPNYDWEYNMTKAAKLLDDAGFADTDANDIRNYPVGWYGREAGPDLDPIKVCVRSDHTQRLTAGRALVTNMLALGIPVNKIEAGSDVLFPMVMDELNYQVYTGGYSYGRYPTYEYSGFNSAFWGVQNYVTGMNASNQPNYPDVDILTTQIYYAPNISESIKACKAFTVLHEKYCLNIPLWSASSFWCYSKFLVGIVNENGYGLENIYTFLNAYKVDNPVTPVDESQQPIRMGTINAPLALNIVYSQWYFDFATLDRIFQSGMVVEPYNLAVDNPWQIQDWETSTWINGTGAECSKVTYWIRHGVTWHAPGTGDEVRPFTAHDMEFTIWYFYAFTDGWEWPGFQDVDHTHVVNDYEIEVYFGANSWVFYGAPVYPFVPRNEYDALSALATLKTKTIVSDGSNCSASTHVKFATGLGDIDTVSVVHSASGALVEGTDYEIVVQIAKKPHNTIHFLKSQAAGTITITYYEPPAKPKGFYLAGLDWSLWMYSIGPYYPIDIAPGVGGVATLDCNPSFFLETPPLGEIDWMWTWTGTTKPRSGYFQIFVYDAVKLLAAYCSRGDTVPSSNWFPGADIDPTDLCHVGLYDAVLILGKYGQKFGTPP